MQVMHVNPNIICWSHTDLLEIISDMHQWMQPNPGSDKQEVKLCLLPPAVWVDQIPSVYHSPLFFNKETQSQSFGYDYMQIFFILNQ